MDVLAAVWFLLVRNPGEHPTVSEVAALFGHAERTFRERWHRQGREPLRSLVPFGCSLRAAWLVHTRGEKSDSATHDVGHVRSWSLNCQLKKRFGVTLCDCRHELPACFDWDRLFEVYAELDLRANNTMEARA
jgi:hypothetical protein